MDKSLSKMSVVTPAAPELQVNTFLDDLLNLEAIEVRRWNCEVDLFSMEGDQGSCSYLEPSQNYIHHTCVHLEYCVKEIELIGLLN